jgi:hypothetical protein
MEFLQNKYTRTYYAIIEKAQSIDRSGYLEEHHIIPRFMKGSNKKSNLVKLTAKEHFIVHLLLTKMFEKDTKFYFSAVYAFQMMTVNTRNQERVHSRMFEVMKKEFSRIKSIKFSGSGNPFYGKTHSEETKEKIVAANARTKDIRSTKFSGENNPMFGVTGEHHPRFGTLHNEETKKKIGDANRGKLCGDNNPAKREDVRQKISAARKGKPIPNLSFELNPRSKLTNDQRIVVINDWFKHQGTLYSFATKWSKEYSVSRGCIQGLVYPECNLERNKKLLVL